MAVKASLLGPRTVTLVDQVLSSVSNVLAVILVARALNATDFGRFALGYAVLTLALTLSRAYFGTRVSLARDRETARRLTAAIVAGLVLVSPALVLAVLGLAMLIAGSGSIGLLLIVALATPVVLVQDIVRVGSAASGEPWAALLSDAVWVTIMAAPFALRLDLGSTTALSLWALAAVTALVVALGTYRVRPRFRQGVAELRRRDAMGESVMVGALVVNVGLLLLLAVVSRALGLASAGSLRGAATTMGPVNVLISFAGLGLTPALVRRDRGQDRRFCLTTAAVMVGLTSAWGAVLLLIPSSVGRAAFGVSWDGIRNVLPLTLCEYLLTCVTTAAILGLKVRNEPRPLRRLRLAAAAVTVLAGTTAALTTHDVRVVAAALALSAATAASLGWVSLLRSRVEPTVQAAIDPIPA